ncbi:hypothetical protein PUNSTDRAFT_77991, partial [Punctularia strigosozonata HHB-11173 SS5]
MLGRLYHCKDNTPHGYLNCAQHLDKLRRLSKRVRELTLEGFNQGRKLAVRMQRIDDLKRYVMLVAEGNVSRMHIVTSVALRQHCSPNKLVENMEKAARELYKPKSYSEAEFKQSYVLYRIGGYRVAEFAHRTRGLPSVRQTQRKIDAPAIRVSAGFPTVEEVSENFGTFFKARQIDVAQNSLTIKTLGAILMFDELAILKRLHWDPLDNCFKGICREHERELPTLEFNSMNEAKVLEEALLQDKVHIGSEATMGALSVISDDPSLYSAKVIMISPTCKCGESVSRHADLLDVVYKAASEGAKALRFSIYSLASDGDSRRRQALFKLTMTHELSPEDDLELYRHLARMDFFPLWCGRDSITSSFDFKHAQKRLRNTLLREAGVTIRGIHITKPIILNHLMCTPELMLSKSAAESLLNAADRQDVGLMYRLLRALYNLPPPSIEDSPIFAANRRILRLYGKLGMRLLRPYTDATMSLSQQLTDLSAASLVLFELYGVDKGSFIPVQLYSDLQHEIQNVFFTVAKTKRDNPDGKVHLVLCGTDTLETFFGIVRTMAGTDVNFDSYQLGNRTSGASQVTEILGLHPEWDPGSRRLRLGSLSDANEHDVSKFDQLTPRSWIADVSVRDVVPATCWKLGEREAMNDLIEAEIHPSFDQKRASGKPYSLFSPFG